MGNTLSSFNVVPIKERGVRLEVARNALYNLTDESYTIALKKLGRKPKPGEVIVHGYVKEVAQGKSLAEYLLDDPSTARLVGRCNTFLSHTWGTPFADTVAALEEYEGNLPNDAPPCYYFIDFFSIDQFNAKGDLKELGELAKSCETLVLFAKPWSKPAALQRAWCIFELAHGVLGGTHLVLAMPKPEKQLLKAAVEMLNTHGKAVGFLNHFANVNSSEMKASFPKDLAKIRGFMVDEMSGFQSVDELVSTSLRKWVGDTVKALCESFSPQGTREHVIFLHRAGRIFTLLCMLKYDLEAAHLAREICEQLNLDHELETSMNSEAMSLQNLGRCAEAAELYKKLIEKLVIKYGSASKRTLVSMENLGGLYASMKKWNEAEKVLTETLKGFQKLQKPMSINIRSSQTWLARVLRDSGKDVKRAEQLLKEVLDYEIKAFGSERASALISLVEHARCLALQGDHWTALSSYTKALPVLVKAYGEEDVDVKNLRLWISESTQEFEGKTDL